MSKDIKKVSIEEYPNFQLDSEGNIYDQEREKLNTSHNAQGYKILSRRVNGKVKTVNIHRLVAKYFLEPSPNLPGWGNIRFKDGDKENCSVDNLEWCYVNRAVKSRRDLQEVKRELEDKFPHIDFSLFVEYVSNKTKFKAICSKHGEFTTTYNGISSTATGCPKCGNELGAKKNTHSTEKFVNRSRALFGNKFDYSKTVYTKIREDVTLVCNDCGEEYKQKAFVHLNSSGCKFCAASRGQIELYEFLKDYSDNVLFDYYPSWFHRMELDLYLPDLNLAIEYNGSFYHHSDENYYPESTKIRYVDKEYHLRKFEIAKQHNIDLIHVFDFEDLGQWKQDLSLFFTEKDKYKVVFTNDLRYGINNLPVYGKTTILTKEK